MASGIRITEVERISSLQDVDDFYVKKGDKFYRLDASVLNLLPKTTAEDKGKIFVVGDDGTPKAVEVENVMEVPV